MSERLGYDDVRDAGLDDWRMLAQGIHTRFTTGDFATGLRLVDAIGAAAEEADHHPDLTLTYTGVDVRLVSHDVGATTERDLRLAATISRIAAEQGVRADPGSVQQVELALDSPRRSGVQPFWRALLDYREVPQADDEVRDPRGQAPNIWFQESGDDPTRQRWHFDVWVPAEQVRPRLDAVVSAGGRVVAELPEHSFWVVEDAEGNRSCVCTAQGR